MSKTFRPYAPRQAFLLPPSPQEWRPEGHLAPFLLDLIPQLDLSAIYAHYERELRGQGLHQGRAAMAAYLSHRPLGVP